MQRCIEFIKDEPTYSMRTRYIRRNLEMLGVPVPDEVARLDWETRPLVAERDEAFQAALEPGQGVLVSGDPCGIDPFLISLHEVQNQEYDKFLASEWVPYVERDPRRVGPRPEVLFRRRGPSKTPVDDHPLSWIAFHHGPKPRDFDGFTNDYHLIEAMSRRFPDERAGHPVVWISAYVAAIYLNWKTIVSGDFSENGKDCFYRIFLDEKGRPLIQRQEEKLGYRLPTEKEWLFAARANDRADSPWKRLQDSEYEAERAKGKRLENFLTLQPLVTTRDVWTSVENDFGVYGMIGNVREWADTGTEFEEEADASRCQIMGSSSALGPETFLYDFPGIKLYPGNTNPDVGFRWARSVPGEIKQIIDEMRQRRVS